MATSQWEWSKVDCQVVFSFHARMVDTSLWLVDINTCGTANHDYSKVSEALCDMDLQQSHIYFDVQIYTSTHRYGY